MRSWLLANTTYGTWLPGDPRGSVTSVRDHRPGDASAERRLEHDVFGTPYEPAVPGLRRAAAEQMHGRPVLLDLAKADLLLSQFQETAAHRRWAILGLAIMVNHFHMIVQVSGDPDPRRVLADFKAYGSRALNQRFGKPESETCWTTNGSKRKLVTEAALQAAIHYVLYKQPNPLVVWSAESGRLV
jgi:REP element-mobilizing transposase RayT